jgi:hypothetical protein
MKKLIIIITLLCIGCSTFLRYNYEQALRNIPQNTRVVDITNDHIVYETYTTNKIVGNLITVNGKQYATTNGVTFTPYDVVTVNVYKVKYSADGNILNTVKIK